MSIHDNVFDLIDEIAEPTGPILSWKAQLHIKQYINNPDLSVSKVGKAIAEKLRKCELFKDDASAINCFEKVGSNGLFNAFLSALYDECDKRRVLVK